MTEVSDYDATVSGIPFDGGTTYRAGTRFGPQDVRKISALYVPYTYEMAVDLREQMALEMAWDGVDLIYRSFDIDSIDCGFVPGTGWPEPGGFVPREALGLVSKVAAEGICGMELIEVVPPPDQSEITALMGTWVIVDVLGSRVGNGKMGAHKRHVDKPVTIPHGEFEGKRWANAT